jgi:hypothetical protein
VKIIYDRLKEIQWRRGSNELGSLDLLSEVAKKMSKKQGGEVTMIVQFPDWATHVVTSTPEQLPSKNRTWTAKAVSESLERLRHWPGLESVKEWLALVKGEKE